ncbi:MAG: HprK-related kinase B [Gammaproteobacteria bacterium]
MDSSTATIDGRVAAVIDRLGAGRPLLDDTPRLNLDGFRVTVRSNSAALLERLAGYFAHVVDAHAADDGILIDAIEQADPAADLGLGIDFTDWRRETGKSGRKDSYADFPACRVVRKVRTGMVFLQSAERRIAAGRCLDNDNQVINFINAQYMNHLQQQGWCICHAAGAVVDTPQGPRSIAMAGFSGGGKSTLMLHLMGHDGVRFQSNDRLFLRTEAKQTRSRGIPKLPRVNPGTIVHDPHLHELIPAPRRAQLLGLPQAELWDLEEKYDVMIDAVYGPGRIQHEAPCAALVILNWQRGSADPTRMQRVDPAQRPDLLAAVMKSPGPFYQYADGSFFQDLSQPDPAEYLAALGDTPVYEVTGGVRFDTITQHSLVMLAAR